MRIPNQGCAVDCIRVFKQTVINSTVPFRPTSVVTRFNMSLHDWYIFNFNLFANDLSQMYVMPWVGDEMYHPILWENLDIITPNNINRHVF